jgi:hypothetical protein
VVAVFKLGNPQISAADWSTTSTPSLGKVDRLQLGLQKN